METEAIVRDGKQFNYKKCESCGSNRWETYETLRKMLIRCNNCEHELYLSKEASVYDMENKLIRFKTNNLLWRKEYLNLKRNTVRKFDNEPDIRKDILIDFATGAITELYISILNKDTGEEFKRRIKDVTNYDGLYIISW